MIDLEPIPLLLVFEALMEWSAYFDALASATLEHVPLFFPYFASVRCLNLVATQLRNACVLLRLITCSTMSSLRTVSATSSRTQTVPRTPLTLLLNPISVSVIEKTV